MLEAIFFVAGLRLSALRFVAGVVCFAEARASAMIFPPSLGASWAQAAKLVMPAANAAAIAVNLFIRS
jgi:hypothetical protein